MNIIPSNDPVTLAIRHYENKHAVWMNTSVFTEAGKIARKEKDQARSAYDAALAGQPLHRQNLHGVAIH